MSIGCYKLDANNKPVPVEDTLEWARWFETANRVVASTRVRGAYVSTIFLGLDHAFGMGPPVLYETMIFGGPHDQYQERCCTREEAVVQHAEAVVVAHVPWWKAAVWYFVDWYKVWERKWRWARLREWAKEKRDEPAT